MKREEYIAVARGERPADLLLRSARLVNVLTGEIHPADIAIAGGYIIGWGDYQAREVIDLAGAFVCPGFIDAHVHLESSMVTPAQFARAVVPRGTTAVIADPHEIANVLGVEGIRYILRASEGIPLRVFVMVSSCVPATHMETAGASVTPADVRALLGERRVLGLAEMMNYPGVLFRLPAVLEMLEAAGDLPVDGHAPGLSGKDLHAYIGAGIRSDHECTTAQEALEKARAGMHIHIREGTAARNLMDLLPAVTPHHAGMFSFCTDDRHPAELLREGHLDDIVRKAIAAGLPPIAAIQMATIHTARHYRLWELGAVAPGYRADLLVLEDLEGVQPAMVFHDGRLVARDGKLVEELALPPAPSLPPTMRIAWERVSFALPAPPAGTAVRVIGVIPDQIITRSLRMEPRVEAGQIVADVSRDLLKIAVVERHHASGNVGVGLVQGMGLRRGAIASSVAHDSHNIVVVGVDDRSMHRAVRAVAEMGGGQAVADGEEVLERLPLPIAGLISDQPLERVQEAGEAVRRAAQTLGCTLSDPAMTLSFLALPVIPALKITDMGLVDVERFALVPLWD